jgi:hypothetical protein
MKKLVMTAAVLACAASIVSAQVYSQNVVGYAKVVSPGNGLNMLGAPFLGTNAVDVTTLIGNNVPVGTKIYVYSDGAYSSILEYKVITGPPPAFTQTTNWNGSATVDGTTGFWLSLPAGASDNTTVFSGEVPQGDMNITIYPGLNMINYPYPASVLWTNTAFAQNPTVGDKVYTWDANSQSYDVINEYKIFTGPPPAFAQTTNWQDQALSLKIGKGIWYSSASVTTNVVTVSQPYTL